MARSYINVIVFVIYNNIYEIPITLISYKSNVLNGMILREPRYNYLVLNLVQDVS